jgi:ammonium transporter, Amt family
MFRTPRHGPVTARTTQSIFRQRTDLVVRVAGHAPAVMLLLGVFIFLNVDTAAAQVVLPKVPADGRPNQVASDQVASDQVEWLMDERSPGEEALSHADNAWGLICAALLLMMVAPGLTLFYGGQVRKKNVLSVMMQTVFLGALMTVAWAIWGYSLSFGGLNSHAGVRWIGTMEFLGMRGVARNWDEELQRVVTPMWGSVPRLTHLLTQGMFFTITPVLMCGAFAERMKFGAVVLLSTLWGTLVYCPLCCWIWGGGPLTYGVEGAILGGVLDHAGGAVVHVSAGIAALICALFVGKRLGYRLEPMPPHNLTYTTLGAAMLWVGWFGFNGARSLSADAMTAQALVATHLSASAGALAWAGLEWSLRRRPSVLGTCSGAIAGLVCISSAAGFVHPLSALFMGGLSGMTCFFACTKLKNALGYDDSLDVFGVHGVGGILGVLLTALFATRHSLQVNPGNPVGLIDGNPHLLLGHLFGLGVTAIYTVVMTFLLLKLVDAFVGLRVIQEHEVEGLDVTEHGEEGYIYL